MFSTARWRLTIWFAAVVILILAVLGVAILLTARASLFENVNNDLRERTETRVLAPFAGAPPTQGRLRQVLLDLAATGGYFYAVMAPDGRIVEHTSNIDIEGLPDGDELLETAQDGPRFIDTKNSEGENLRVYVVPLEDSPSDRPFFLEVGRSTEPERQALRQITRILAGGGAVGVALAIAGGFVLSGLALRPIQAAMSRQRAFVADASHEIRTPLTLIRAHAELMQRSSSTNEENIETASVIISETDRLNNLVTQMLTLARSDADHTTFEMANIDLADIAADTAQEMRLLAEPKRISVESDIAGPVVIEGDDTRLRELLTILIDNSIKYSDEGSSVKVSVEESGGKAQLTVSDNGRGIPEDALPRIFDRFYRADRARSREMGGTGLGLAIAKWIVVSHHGHIDIDSRPGEGTTVSVSLPTAS